MSESNPESKVCAHCGRLFEWRRKWSTCWNRVKFCSKRCRNTPLGRDDDALERKVVSLLQDRPRGASICPSQAAVAVGGDDWRRLMPHARRAANRLVARGVIDMLVDGRVVRPSAARGPVRLRFARVAPSHPTDEVSGSGRADGVGRIEPEESEPGPMVEHSAPDQRSPAA